MADVLKLGDDTQEMLARAFQSGNINFIIGSGASRPAIETVGNIERDIDDLFKNGSESDAYAKLYDLVWRIQEPTNKLIANDNDPQIQETLSNYVKCIGVIERILVKRASGILPKQANLFTTNYDLFIEKASENYSGLKLNDGFTRVPSLENKMRYSSRDFFNSLFNIGNLYGYKVEIPCINLIKLHGSLSWKNDKDDVIFNVRHKDFLNDLSTKSIQKFLDDYALVLPRSAKFRETLMERVHYDLLRIYANQLERENTLLIAFGFSFADAHIYDISCRALKNPTLKLVIFSFNDASTADFVKKFDGHSNVQVISMPAAVLDFKSFNEFMLKAIPKMEELR